MLEARLPVDEAQRLSELADCRVVDTPPERDFDDLAQLAAQICGTPTALVSLVTKSRQWFKARVGLDASETQRRVAFCAHAILQPDSALVIPDALLDERFADNPLVTSPPFLRFYAGVPLRMPSGQALGTLCVLDQQPRQLSAAQLEALGRLARQVVGQLELRKRCFELERSRNQTQALAQLQAARLAQVTQAIRRPLTNVLGFGALLAETSGLPAGVQAQASAIESGGRDILHLSESLRDLSALDAGVLNLHPSPVLLSELLRQLAARYRPSANMRGLTLTLELDARCDWPLLVDGSRLTLLVRTLLENALRHTEEGQIDLVLTQLSEGCGLESVLIEVRDTGRGIAPERQRVLFQPEPESDPSGPQPWGSAGFNLASCHRLACLMGIDFGLDYSLLGHGSSFFLRLEAQRCVTRAESRPGHAQDSERLDGLTAVVVESEPDTQSLLAGWLSAAGATVQLLSEGRPLLEKLKGPQEPGAAAIGLVLLDLQLPGERGLEVLRQLRAAGDQTPVIALCSSDAEHLRKSSLAAGANEFCPKPVGRATLLALCLGLVANRREARAARDPRGERLAA